MSFHGTHKASVFASAKSKLSLIDILRCQLLAHESEVYCKAGSTEAANATS